ncbi:MAG: hypothetical protein R3E66_18470 [bacterium]
MSHDDEDVFSTRRISADELVQLHKALQTGTVDLSVSVTPDVLERIERLLPKIREGDEETPELQRAMALRQIFMTGLYALESEFES